MNRLPTPAARAAAAMLQATNPRKIPLTALRQYEQFAAEVIAEAGHDVLDDIVDHLVQHCALMRGAA